MEFGISVDGMAHAEDLVNYAKMAEECGYDYVTINDVYFDRSPFPILGAFSRETRRVKIGTNVTNPFIRHPVDLASQIATIHELSGGRAFLGISSGSPRAFDFIDIKADRPATGCREAIEIIRRLHRGESVTFPGKVFRTIDAKLTFPVSSQIPIFHAGAGPRMIAVAAELADGMLIGLGPHEFDRYVIETYKAELTKARKQPKKVEIAKNIVVSVSEDRDAALRLAREQYLVHIARKIDESPATLEKFVGIDADRAERIKANLKGYRGDPKQLAGIITDDIMEHFVIVGTPEECVAKIREKGEMGVTHIEILHPTLGVIKGMADIIKLV